MKGKQKFAAIVLLLSITLAAYFVGPVPQSQAYHHFADQRTFWGIPRFFDVISNLGFLVVGIWGTLFVINARSTRRPSAFLSSSERWPYLIFFVGVSLTAFGSGYYHLAPDNARLVWDRLPMAVGFMGLLAAVLGERVDAGLANRALLPLVIAGVGSVLYWRWTEVAGRGDLRIYALVQFGSLAIVLLLCAALPSLYTRGKDMFVVVALYALAKAFEALDKRVFELGGIVSGHTLKHLVASVACFWVLLMLMRRQPAPAAAV